MRISYTMLSFGLQKKINILYRKSWIFTEFDVKSRFLHVIWSYMGRGYSWICLKPLLCCRGTPQGLFPPKTALPDILGVMIFQKWVFVKNSICGSLIWRDIAWKWFVWTIRTILVFGKNEIWYSNVHQKITLWRKPTFPSYCIWKHMNWFCGSIFLV